MSFKLNAYRLTVLCALVTAFGGERAGATPVTEGTTTFTADPGIASLYGSLNIGESLISPASGNLENQPQTLILPIIGGDTTSEFKHAGGVSLSAEGHTVEITNIVIHISGADANEVTADLSFGGTKNNLAVADISGLNELTVDPSFAALIRAAGGPDLAGTPLATFSIQPKLAATATPEPSEVGLLGLGLICFATITMRLRLPARRARRDETAAGLGNE